METIEVVIGLFGDISKACDGADAVSRIMTLNSKYKHESQVANNSNKLKKNSTIKFDLSSRCKTSGILMRHIFITYTT